MYERTRDEGFGPEVKRRIMLGTYVLSAGYYDAYYLKAQQVRTLCGRDYEEAFSHVDVIAMPTTPTPAFKLGGEDERPLQMYLNDVFTVSANLTGLPAISIRAASRGSPADRITADGRLFDEVTLLRAADGYQRDTRWHEEAPDIH
jgi:aspartyl-tRNA(Asn)/glutamyl-tRNA(Gln) amidotransferase subunit A